MASEELSRRRKTPIRWQRPTGLLLITDGKLDENIRFITGSNLF